MDRRVTPPARVTSPTWEPHLHVNRPLVFFVLKPLLGIADNEVVKNVQF